MLPALDRPDVNYVLTNDYEIRFYPKEIQDYILTHFQPVPGKKNVWVRIK